MTAGAVTSPAAGGGGDAPARAGTGAPRKVGQGTGAAYLLLLPSVFVLVTLFLWPLVQGVLMSLGGTGQLSLAPYAGMLADPRFWDAVRNTLLIVVVAVPLQLLLALSMGLILEARPRFRGFFLYCWAVPLAVSDLAAGLVWLSIFTDRGYLNSTLSLLGLGQGYSWLSYQNTTSMFFAVVVAELWRATSLVLVIVVAGMQMIPRDYDEAAQVFGAGFWQRLWHVTLPLLKPSLQVALILRTILAFQTFAVVQALTGDNFPVLVGETYTYYASLQNSSVAAAFAMLILAISMVTSVLYLRLLRTSRVG